MYYLQFLSYVILTTPHSILAQFGRYVHCIDFLGIRSASAYFCEMAFLVTVFASFI